MSLVFMLDVDNTLLDNDRVKADLERRIGSIVGAEEHRFWELYEAVRHEKDVVDFPLTLERFRQGYANDERYERLAHLLDGYRFDRHLFPHAIETIQHLKSLGRTVVVSDGDQVFQPRKIEESGIADAVEGQVFVYVHKEQSIKEVIDRFRASRYVMVDDKQRILAALKRSYPDRMTAVHVRQGHYAHQDTDMTPHPDIEVNEIADLRRLSAEDFEPPSRNQLTGDRTR